jgi:glucose uptake protein
MFYPQDFGLAMLLLLFSVLGWGSWPNLFKIEMNVPLGRFYAGFVLGMLGAIFTVFMILIFTSDFSVYAGMFPQKTVLAFLSGITWNVANYHLLKAIRQAGISLAFAISIGLATLFSVSLSYIVNPVGFSVFLFSGLFFIVTAIFLNGVIYAQIYRERLVFSYLVMIIASFMTFSTYLVAVLFAPPDVLDPYWAQLIFALGVAASSIFLISLDVSFKFVEVLNFFRHGSRYGIIAGTIWLFSSLFFYLCSMVVGWPLPLVWARQAYWLR